MSGWFNASKYEDDRVPFLKREGRPDASIIERERNRGDEPQAQLRRMKARPLFRQRGADASRERNRMLDGIVT